MYVCLVLQCTKVNSPCKLFIIIYIEKTSLIIINDFLQITSTTVVCSLHFKREDFKWTPVRKTLLPESIPSIFPWTKEAAPRRIIAKLPIPETPRKKLRIEVDPINEQQEEPVETVPEVNTSESGQ